MGQGRLRRRRRARRSVVVVAVAAVALTACVADLGTLGGPTSRAAAIAADGTIVGTSADAAGFERAFLWDPTTGEMRDLGGVWSLASGVNRNLVVGWIDTSTFQSVGMVWDRAGRSTPLRHDGFDAGIPLAIDDSGFIAGYLYDEDAPWERTGAVWGPDSELYTFAVTPPMGPPDTTPNDINGHLQAVGTGELTPFVWDPVGGVRTLEVPEVNGAPAYGYAEAINDRGDIVGSYRDANGAQQSAVWDATTGERRDPADPGGASSHLVDVNNGGMAIGTSVATIEPFPAAPTSYCVSLVTGRITDLGNATVVAINDDGVITGLSNGRSVRWSADTCPH
jgi:probable HAF family extracellular repeat protein